MDTVMTKQCSDWTEEQSPWWNGEFFPQDAYKEAHMFKLATRDIFNKVFRAWSTLESIKLLIYNRTPPKIFETKNVRPSLGHCCTEQLCNPLLSRIHHRQTISFFFFFFLLQLSFRRKLILAALFHVLSQQTVREIGNNQNKGVRKNWAWLAILKMSCIFPSLCPFLVVPLSLPTVSLMSVWHSAWHSTPCPHPSFIISLPISAS